MKAILPVAGLGTRMPPIVDKPFIRYVVNEAVAAGIKQLCWLPIPVRTLLSGMMIIDIFLKAQKKSAYKVVVK
ncbi:hypothetical protein ACG1BZ_04255 [Microbulbifer sp. CNSA002]|uniref:hypothetical protein n=1 Tax=Microbulbifer sp. CNSA002 TaxID=3373604 RepID=UPI0039B6C3BC